MTTTYFKEHSEIARPDWLGAAWRDFSWHNDAMPHATLFLIGEGADNDPVVEVWVNYQKSEDRQIPPAYMVMFQKTFVVESSGDWELYAGEDEQVAKRWARAAEIAKTIIADIVKEPALLGCRSLSELHDHVDANELGEQGAFLESLGWTGKDDVKDAQALAASTDVLNCAQEIVDYWLRAR